MKIIAIYFFGIKTLPKKTILTKLKTNNIDD